MAAETDEEGSAEPRGDRSSLAKRGRGTARMRGGGGPAAAIIRWYPNRPTPPRIRAGHPPDALRVQDQGAGTTATIE